jgi:predicted RNase H-like HicB family nuclease
VKIEVLTGAIPLHDEDGQSGILSAYFDAAMRHAIFRRAGEQQRIYSAIPGIRGLWASGQTREEAKKDLRGALEWWVLTCVFEHQPLPAFDGVSLEIVAERKDGSKALYPVAPSSAANVCRAVHLAPTIR